MRRVLVIEDNDDLRNSITRFLEAKGFEVSAAANGHQGLESQRKNPADIVVVDLLMPENDGIDPIVELHREFPRTEIIAVSGGVLGRRFDDLPVARKLSAAKSLKKPFDPQELVDAMLASSTRARRAGQHRGRRAKGTRPTRSDPKLRLIH